MPRSATLTPRDAHSGLSLEIASTSEDEPGSHLSRGESLAVSGAVYVAQYDFDRKQGSQLSFRKGDRMVVLSRKSHDWWRVRLGAQTGEVPTSYIVPEAGSSRALAGSARRSPPARTRSRSASPVSQRRTSRRSRSTSPTRSPRGEARSSPRRSRVVLLRNMIDQDDSIPDEELPLLEEDVAAECDESGAVKGVTIVPARRGDAEVYVEFERSSGAERALTFFNDVDDADDDEVITTAELFSEVEYERIAATETARRAKTSRRRGGKRGGAGGGRLAERHAAMARRLAHEVTEELREALLDDGYEDLASAFDRMDVDRNGYLTAAELKRGLRSLTGVGLSSAALDLLMGELDADGDNEIDYNEFVDAFRRSTSAKQLAGDVTMLLRKRLRTHRHDLTRVFNEYDTNGDGVLSVDEFKRGLREEGIRLSSAETAELMSVFDKDGDSRIDYREFLEVLGHESGSPSPRGHRSPSAVRSPRGRRETSTSGAAGFRARSRSRDRGIEEGVPDGRDRETTHRSHDRGVDRGSGRRNRPVSPRVDRSGCDFLLIITVLRLFCDCFAIVFD